MGDVLFLILRRIRAPLITLIVVYAVSMIGLVAIPGADAAGKPWTMSFFHAFYVMSYTATTIGFGEIPYPFTDAQRLWVACAIFLSVIGWAYAIGSMLALAQDPVFRDAVARSIFVRKVRRLHEPFYVVCGYGQSGASVARALDLLDARVVVIEQNAARATAVVLEDYRSPPLVLVGDARLPDVLDSAGVSKPSCQGVLVLTSNDEANQSIAVGARVANPSTMVIAKVTTNLAHTNLEAIGGIRIVDPYRAFAENIQLDLSAPVVLQVEDWLTGVPGARRPEPMALPHGHWVIAGFGRFGHAVADALDVSGQTWSAFDSHAVDPRPEVFVETDTEEALERAGIVHAVGLVVCTDSDAANLTTARVAHRLSPRIQVVIRRNKAANRRLIEAADARMVFVQSDVITHECLQLLTTPLLARFLQMSRFRGGPFAEGVRARLQSMFGDEVPAIWTLSCDPREPGMRHALFDVAPPLRIGDLMRDPTDPTQELAVVPLMRFSEGVAQKLPDPDQVLGVGDQVLFAGTQDAQQRQRRFLLDPSPIDYLRTGAEPARGWLFRWLARRRAARGSITIGP